jgi:Na+(H+)/acetate symporter ActP
LLATAGAIIATLAGPPVHGWVAILVAQPAPWSVPLAFGTMVVVSLFGRPPAWATAAMLRLHLRESDPDHSTVGYDRSSTVRRMVRRFVRD